MSQWAFNGILRLPDPVLVAADALGETFTAQVDRMTFGMTFPALPDPVPDGYFDLVSPLPISDQLAELIADAAGKWGNPAYERGGGGDRPLASTVRRVAIEVTVDGNAALPSPRLVGDNFDALWRDALAWLEVWTPQHLIPDRNAPGTSRAHVLAASMEGQGVPTGWGYVQTLRPYASHHAVTRAMIIGALDRSARDEHPPLEWQLLTRAIRMRDRRQALLNVASAAEVALSRVVEAELGGLTADAKERIINGANGVAGLLQLVDALRPAQGAPSWRRVSDHVAHPRNHAAHRGTEPTSEILERAIGTVANLLAVYSPMPEPS